MIRRRKPEWQRLISGLYVPPLLWITDPYPCDDCCGDCTACVHCETTPDAYEMVIANSVDMDGTYILRCDFNPPCQWGFVFSGKCLDQIRLFMPVFQTDTLRARLENGSPEQTFGVDYVADWVMPFGATEHQCGAANNTLMTLVSSGGLLCSDATTTLTITAL